MVNQSTTQGESPESKARNATPAKGGNIADLLTALDNGIRITGILLAAEAPKQFSGTSKGGKAYAFANREMQIWTGSKAATCTDRRERVEDFQSLPIGDRVSFRILNVRMNGTVPVFEVETV